MIFFIPWVLKVNTKENEFESFFRSWINKNNAQKIMLKVLLCLTSHPYLLTALRMSFLQKGYNRDGEPLDQVNLGVISKKTLNNNSPLPLAYRIYPRSIANVTTLKNVCAMMSAYKVKSEMLIMDKGFYSLRNINEMSQEGLNYLIPMSFTNKGFKKILSLVFDRIFDPDRGFILNSTMYSHISLCTLIYHYVLSYS